MICDDGKHRSELEMYCAHLLGLWPGKTVPVFLVHTTEPKDVSVWEEAEQELLVAEGRRQLDEQQKQLEQVRGRAQFLFTTCLGLAAVSVAGRSTVFAAASDSSATIWSIGLLMTALGALGAGAIVVGKKSVGAIDAALLTTVEQPVLPKLAAGYSRAIRTGENTVATSVTAFRDAAFLVFLGAVCWGVAWLTATV